MRHSILVLPFSFCALAIIGPSAVAVQQCTFTYRGASVGDVGEQTIEVKLNVTRTIRQAGTDISASEVRIERQQDRSVRVLEVAGMVATKARIAFPLARQTVHARPQPPVPQDQPIQGKSYDVARVGESLQIRSLQDAEASEEERVLVEAAMGALGRPNPLGTLLHERTLAIGETLEIPAEMVGRFLGMQTSSDSRLHLRLIAIEDPAASSRRAVFSAAMHSQAGGPAGMTFQVTGRWIIDPITCQTVSADFRGPLQSVETHGPVGAQFLVTTSGQLELQLRGRTDHQLAQRTPSAER